MKDKKIPLMFDTDVIRFTSEPGRADAFPFPIGPPVIRDGRCESRDIVVTGKGAMTILNPFLLFDEMHPLIDSRSGRIIGVLDRKTLGCILYDEEKDLRRYSPEIGRYLQFAPYWRVIYECIVAEGTNPYFLLVQN